jgi:hypothetical protein
MKRSFSLSHLIAPAAATATILDNEQRVSIAVTTHASEVGLTPGTFTVTRTGSNTSALIVTYTLAGTAKSGVDYTAIATSVTIPANENSALITVTPLADSPTLLEGPETVLISLKAAATYSLGTPVSATMTIVDALANVRVEATDASATESGAGTGTFTISRTGDLTDELEVQFGVSGTAVEGTDYTVETADQVPLTTPFAVVLPANEAAVTITVVPVDDAVVEDTETAIVTLSASLAYTITGSGATVEISDDEPTVTIAATTPTSVEGGAAGTFTVSRSGSTVNALTVNFSAAGTATAGDDYTAIGSSVTIPAGQLSAAISVTAVDDTAVEPVETVVLTLQPNGAAYIVGAQESATVSVQSNDDPAAVSTITVTASAATTSEAGAPAQFTIARTGSTAWPLTVSYTVAGNAAAGTDYTALAGSVVIPEGASSADITLSVIDDTAPEADEAVVLTLAAGAFYIVGATSSASITIVDDEPRVGITATDPFTVESSADYATFTVYRTGDVTLGMSVKLVFSGTASLGRDYKLKDSVLIPAGAASVDILVKPTKDALAEGDESLVVTPLALAGYSVTGESAAIYIQDLPTINIVATQPTALNTPASNQHGLFTITRTGSTDLPILLKFKVTGTAKTKKDFLPLPKNVIIPAGASSVALPIVPVAYPTAQPDKTLIIAVAKGKGYNLGAAISGRLTIVDGRPRP